VKEQKIEGTRDGMKASAYVCRLLTAAACTDAGHVSREPPLRCGRLAAAAIPTALSGFGLQGGLMLLAYCVFRLRW